MKAAKMSFGTLKSEPDILTPVSNLDAIIVYPGTLSRAQAVAWLK